MDALPWAEAPCVRIRGIRGAFTANFSVSFHACCLMDTCVQAWEQIGVRIHDSTRTEGRWESKQERMHHAERTSSSGAAGVVSVSWLKLLSQSLLLQLRLHVPVPLISPTRNPPPPPSQSTFASSTSFAAFLKPLSWSSLSRAPPAFSPPRCTLLSDTLVASGSVGPAARPV